MLSKVSSRMSTATALMFVLSIPHGMAWSDPPAAPGQDPQPSRDAEWSQTVDGLQFRLKAPRSEFESWELPAFLVEIRNQGSGPVTAVRAENLLGDGRNRPGPLFLYENLHRVARNTHDRWLSPRIRCDHQKLVGLKAGSSIAIEATLVSLFEERWPEGEQIDPGPGRHTIGLGNLSRAGTSQLITNAVTLQVLPPGVLKQDEFAAWLKPHVIEGQALEVGFIPNKTTIVEGEPMFVTMVIRNRSDAPFPFEFGGDYRGSGRHNRFRIEAVGGDGKPLVDPQGGRGDFGGIVMPRRVAPQDLDVETVELALFRTFPGPGEYTISCAFDLEPGPFDKDRTFKVPVATTYVLRVLPREPKYVQRVLDPLFEQCKKTGSGALVRLVDVICSFGKEAAAPGLAEMIAKGDVEHRIAAATGLGKVASPEALEALVPVLADKESGVRAAVVSALGHFTADRAVEAIVRALSDADEPVRTAAAAALGSSKTGSAVDALISRLPDAPPVLAAAILRAMGATKSPRVFDILEKALASGDEAVRGAALEGIVNFPAEQGVAALKPFATQGEMDFREAVIGRLAETYRQPIDPQWLVTVIRSRRNANSIGDAPRLLRLYAGDKAAPTLVSCLDFDDPNIRNYFNMALLDDQLACHGLAIPWIADLNRDGTAQEIEQNRRTLKQLKGWVDRFTARPWDEPPLPWRLPQAAEEASWGIPVDDLSIRARVNRTVWPSGLPQVVILEARGAANGGSVIFQEPLVTCEVEVDGEWYARKSTADTKVVGNWNAYHGHAQHDLQLDDRWRRLTDELPLALKAGRHTVRVRLSATPKEKQTGLATTRPVEFEVLP